MPDAKEAILLAVVMSIIVKIWVNSNSENILKMTVHEYLAIKTMVLNNV